MLYNYYGDLMDKVLIKGHEIPFKIVVSNRKSISFSFRDGVLNVRTPLAITMSQVLQSIKKNEDAIFEKLILPGGSESLKFTIGQTIRVVEEEYIIKEAPTKRIVGNVFYVKKTNVLYDVLNLALKIFYPYISKRTKEFYDIMYDKGVCPSLEFKYTKSYYGKCYYKQNRIVYNIALAFLDKELIDYVIVHELAHLKYPDHQQGFHDYLKVFLPNYKFLEKRLKKEGKVK